MASPVTVRKVGPRDGLRIEPRLPPARIGAAVPAALGRPFEGGVPTAPADRPVAGSLGAARIGPSR